MEGSEKKAKPKKEKGKSPKYSFLSGTCTSLQLIDLLLSFFPVQNVSFFFGYKSNPLYPKLLQVFLMSNSW